jgi:dihydroorotate dehydrogenase (NAD+) catalytic subunit
MNVSCPNVKKGGVEFGVVPEVLRDLTRAVRAACKKPLLVKLTPNTQDVVAIARAAVEGGADGLSVVNTVTAMAIDARRRRPRIATTYGGVATGEDVIEFLLAGATTVQVGTISFADPSAAGRILDELERFLSEEKVADVRELIGALRA